MLRFTSCLFLTLFVCSPAVAEMPKVGDAAPEFEMKGTDGKTYALKDFVGKQAVVLAWFPRAFTGGCTKECKSMKDSGELLKKFDVAYFTASTDEIEGEKGNAAFAKSLDLDYPILSDPTGKNAKMFGVYTEGRNAASRVTFVIGKDGKILAVEDKVKTESHGEDIARLLGELEVALR